MANKQTRKYRRITPQTVAEFKVAEHLNGNGSKAVRDLTPGYFNEGNRAFRIRKKAQTESSLEYIDNTLQVIGVDAINRLGDLVNSTDEKVAGVNTRYVIDQLKGKAVQKSVNLSAKVNIQSVLD